MTCIVMTYGDVGSPHLDSLRESNPDVEVHVATSPETGESREILWRNSDRFLRKWWQENSEKVEGGTLYMLEWDTLVTCPLPAMPEDLNLVSSGLTYMKPWKPPHRDPRERAWKLLGLPDGSEVVQMGTFGFFIVRRSVMDAIADAKWDAAFAADASNEGRFPTIAAAIGAKMGVIRLPNVHYFHPPVVSGPGIYHPVKP